MASIHADLDAMDQERSQSISQEAIQCSLKYEVGEILDELWMSSLWDIWGFSYHHEYEAIDPNIFAATVWFVDRTKKLVSSKFIGMLISVLVIFGTVDTY